VLEIYKKNEAERQSKLLAFVTSHKVGMEAQISSEMPKYFVKGLKKFNSPKRFPYNIIYKRWRYSATWSLINLIKQFCEEYEVIVPSKAISAGTLICLESNNVVTTKQATLDPADPSLNSHLNPKKSTSKSSS